MSGDFEPEQKRYLEGFVAGLQIAKAAGGIARNGSAGAVTASTASPEPAPASVPTGFGARLTETGPVPSFPSSRVIAVAWETAGKLAICAASEGFFPR